MTIAQILHNNTAQYKKKQTKCQRPIKLELNKDKQKQNRNAEGK